LPADSDTNYVWKFYIYSYCNVEYGRTNAANCAHFMPRHLKMKLIQTRTHANALSVSSGIY